MMRMLSNEELALRWGELSPRVDKALSHGLGETVPYDLFKECLSGNAHAWDDGKAFGITRYNHFPQYKQLQVVVSEGAWGPEQLEFLEEFARQTGCRNVSIWGRKGWARRLKDYSEPYKVLIKEV